MITVDEAITGRRSVRAFLSDPVSRKSIEHILSVASRAPSGTNTQPWQVHVLFGNARQRLTDAVVDAFKNEQGQHDHERLYYMTEWREPYISRRRKVGWDMYGLVGITKDNREGMIEQTARNYKFFDAPVGLIFTIDQDMHWGSWLDIGMFIENVMLAARGQGLESCPQAAFANYHKVVRKILDIPDSQAIVCGMSIGKEDTSAVINELITVREPVEAFTTFHSE